MVNFEKLNEALAEQNIRLTGCSDKEVLAVAKSVGLDVNDFTTHTVEITEYTNKRDETNTFVKTSKFITGRKENGKAATVQGLFLRVEIIDQAIEDLLKAKELLSDNDED